MISIKKIQNGSDGLTFSSQILALFEISALYFFCKIQQFPSSTMLLILYPFLQNLTTQIAIAKILNFDECDARILFHTGSLALTKSFHAN